MVHTAKKAPSDKVDSAINDSIEEHKDLLKRLEKEEMISLEKKKRIIATGRVEHDLSIDGLILSEQMSTGKVSEPVNVYCTYSTSTIGTVVKELETFGE